VETSSLCLSAEELASNDLRDLGVDGGVSVARENLGSFFTKLGLLHLLLLEIVGARYVLGLLVLEGLSLNVLFLL